MSYGNVFIMITSVVLSRWVLRVLLMFIEYGLFFFVFYLTKQWRWTWWMKTDLYFKKPWICSKIEFSTLFGFIMNTEKVYILSTE